MIDECVKGSTDADKPVLQKDSMNGLAALRSISDTNRKDCTRYRYRERKQYPIELDGPRAGRSGNTALKYEHVGGSRGQDDTDTREQSLDHQGREFRWDKANGSHVERETMSLKLVSKASDPNYSRVYLASRFTWIGKVVKI